MRFGGFSRGKPPPPNSTPPPPANPPSISDDELPPPDDDDSLPPPDDDELSAPDFDDDMPPPDDDGDELPPPDDDSQFGSLPAPSDDGMSLPPDEDALSDPEPDDDPMDDPEDEPLDDPEDEPVGDPEDEPDDYPDDEPDDEPDFEPEDEPMDPDDEPDFDLEDDSLPPPDDEPSLGDPEDDDLPSEEGKASDAAKSKFILPVAPPKAPGRNPEPPKIKAQGDGINLNLNSLTAGLTVKNPPSLLGKAGPVSNVPFSTPAHAKYSEPSSPPSSPQAQSVKSVNPSIVSTKKNEPTEDFRGQINPEASILNEEIIARCTSMTDVKQFVRNEALRMGYVSCFGKFEGDTFEPLFLFVDTDNSRLTVVIETGQQIHFELTKKTSVYEDSKEITSFIFDYYKNIIVFKFDNEDTLIRVMKMMPPQVFMVEEAEEISVKKPSKSNIVVNSVPATVAKGPSSPRAVGTRDNDHIRGTSVEDILEDDYQGPMYFTNEEVEKLFATTPHYMHPPLPLSVKPPQRRKELLESYIRKPKYSVRRVKLLCEWLNSLHLWPTARITVRNLHKEMLNGLLLARMVKRVNPGVIFVNLNQKALTKKSAMQNLEQALGHIWRSKSLNNSRIPSAAEIYNGSTFKIAVLLNEFFGVYVQRPLYKTALKTLKWYHGILRQYLLPIPPTTFSEGDLSGIWPHFQSGTALFCVIFHFFGPSIVGEKKTHIRVDPLRIVRDAACYGDMISNVEYVFDLLRALDIDVVWEAADWLTNPDTEFIILQLNYIYNTLKTRQCCLPPAQGQVAGITSGPNGDPVVAGIVFADSKVANSKVLVSSTRKAVLLGNGKDALPLLPIDRASRSTGRFNSTSCPLGMISHAVDIPLTYKSLKESKLKLERDDWNKSASVKSEKHTPAGEQIIALLRGTKIDNAVSDLKISTDDRSVSPNGDKKSKLSPETKSTRLAASPTSAKKIEHISKAPTQRLRELDIQMKSLEKNMQTSQGQLRSLEDDLATRYLELEASAHYCDIQEYEDALANLETERIELEQEKSRLQEHFANRLESLREMYREAESLAKANYDESVCDGSVVSRSKNKQGTKKKGGEQEKQQLEVAEKGWIKLATKMNTHNYHLKNAQNASSAALKATWTPKRLKEKEEEWQKKQKAQTANTSSPVKYAANTLHSSAIRPHYDIPTTIFEAGDISTPLPALATALMSQEEVIETSFSKFKYRLHVASMKWIQSQQMTGRARLQDMIAAAPKTATVELISLPEKSFSRTADGRDASEIFGSMELRNEELRRLQYEDERRLMVISELEMQRQLQYTQQLLAHQARTPTSKMKASKEKERQIATPQTGGYVSSGSSGSSGHRQSPVQQSHLDHIKPSTLDFDAAMKWLMKPRGLTLVDRHPREFNFELTPMEGNNNRTLPVDSYSLEWRDTGSTSSSVFVAGLVVIGDISTIQSQGPDPASFTVVLKDTTRALKNSRGRTAITLKCSTAAECAKYYSSLMTVLRHLSAGY